MANKQSTSSPTESALLSMSKGAVDLGEIVVEWPCDCPDIPGRNLTRKFV
jgi:hypothetical protein